MAGLQALQSLLKLKSPESFTPTGDPYYDKQHAAVMGGESDLAPSELELMGTQNELGAANGDNPYGVTMSRERINDSAMQVLRRKLGLGAIEAQQKVAQAEAGPRVAGQYDVAASDAKARAAADNLRFQQEELNSRNNADNEARRAQIEAEIAGRKGLQDDAQADKHSTIAPAVLAQIAREQQALRAKASDPKLQPGLLSKIPIIGGAFTPANPAKQQLDQFNNMLKFAQRVYQQYPGQDAASIAALEGEDNLTPEELGQIDNFLMRFRGR